MFQNDDKVYINPSAKEDVGFLAWDYVSNTGYGTIKGALTGTKEEPVPESMFVYAIEFAREFSGGIECQGLCKPKRGQWISAKHLELDFEASRDVVTVPNIEGYEDCNCENCDEKRY